MAAVNAAVGAEVGAVGAAVDLMGTEVGAGEVGEVDASAVFFYRGAPVR